MATKTTKHKQTITSQQFFSIRTISRSKKKQVLSDSKPGPLPSQAHSLPPDHESRRCKEI